MVILSHVHDRRKLFQNWFSNYRERQGATFEILSLDTSQISQKVGFADKRARGYVAGPRVRLLGQKMKIIESGSFTRKMHINFFEETVSTHVAQTHTKRYIFCAD